MSEWGNLWDEDNRKEAWSAMRDWYIQDWLREVKAEGDKLQEQLKDCSEAYKVLYDNAFKIPELQQKLETIRNRLDPNHEPWGQLAKISEVLDGE